MPHLRFRALSEEQVSALSISLSPVLADLLETPEDNFTFEHIPSRFFTRGKPAAAYPFVEVLWFRRSPEAQLAVAEILTRQLKALTEASDVAVVFVPLGEADYFENGKHF